MQGYGFSYAVLLSNVLCLPFRMEASTLASHPLVAAALSGLNFDKCFDASVVGMLHISTFLIKEISGTSIRA